MTSKKHKHEVPAVYKPIMLDLPTPTSREHLMMLATLMNTLNYGEFMRHWRWEKKLVKWLPIMELTKIPVQHPPVMLESKMREKVVGPN